MIDWILRRLSSLPPWGMAVVGLVVVGAVVGSAVAGYRTYDYVEHDNEFCLSCHLMAEPYELFARSAHRDLGCKACHKPTFAARSQMALTQIIENPDTLSTHAEVPNEKCASCHIEGDPDRWESVANSAGHRIHLESDDPALEGLNCVECHSSSLHQFTAASETCAQSGCHVDSGVQLGGMSDLTIHCTACHGFSEPVPEGTPLEAVMAAVQPDAAACLSCHAMRTLVEMPPDEPHEAVCGSCHNPHEQTEPSDAVQTCATSDCHSRPAELTPMHRGLGVGVLAECTQCHGAHDWDVQAENCLSCHGDVFEERGAAGVARAPLTPDGAGQPGGPTDRGSPVANADPAAPTGGPAPGPDRLGSDPPSFPVAPAVRAYADHVDLRPGGAPATPPQAVDTTFSHRRHRSVECTQCHSTEESHGRITLFGLNDCRSCHHRAPVSDDCSTCHAETRSERVYPMTRTLSFTVGTVSGRDLPFDHRTHAEAACSTCHTREPAGDLRMAASNVECAACHEEHHTPMSSCMACHETAPAGAHPNEVHEGCTGSGCHTEVVEALAAVPRTRPFCLSCHQDQVEHRPGRSCEECHRLPGVRPGGGGGA